jgi:hypothetical protein
VSEDPDWVEEINGIYDDWKANAPSFDVMFEEIEDWPRYECDCDGENDLQHSHHKRELKVKQEIKI